MATLPYKPAKTEPEGQPQSEAVSQQPLAVSPDAPNHVKEWSKAEPEGQPQSEAVSQQLLAVSPDAPSHVKAWSKMTPVLQGLDCYLRQERSMGVKTTPSFRRGRIWA
jgi:hypothetical protein